MLVGAWISHKDNGALVKLNMSKNSLLTVEGGRAIGDMLKTNSVLKELDVSESGEGMGFYEKNGPGFGAGVADADAIKVHPFFEELDWELVLAKGLQPGYQPDVKDETDTSNFEHV